jgi:hypothetical protein
MWTGLSGLSSLQWLCLRWLEALPVACLAPLTNLVVLQLKAITRPPGGYSNHHHRQHVDHVLCLSCPPMLMLPWLPVACLAPLTKLVLQLETITRLLG